MKKILIGLLLVLCFSTFSYAQGRNTTDRLASSSLIRSGPSMLYGVLVETDGTNNATITVYDNTTNSGKIIRKMIVPGANYYGGFELPAGLLATTGIYVSISGTGAAYWVTFGRQ